MPISRFLCKDPSRTLQHGLLAPGTHGLALNGTLLCGVTRYAPINALGSLLSVGKSLDFGFAIIYAVEAQQGVLGYEAYVAKVAKVARALQVELYFIVPASWPARTLDDWNRLRNAIDAAIGDAGPNRWRTIAFTTDPQWAR